MMTSWHSMAARIRAPSLVCTASCQIAAFGMEREPMLAALDVHPADHRLRVLMLSPTNAALGLVGSLAQSTVMLGLFFFVLSLLTVLNVYFFFLFGAIQSLSECNMIKDRYSLFRVALAPRHAYRPLTRAPSASARHQPLPGDARRYRVHGPADAARRVVVRACVQLTAAVEGACSQEGVRR